MNKKKIVILSIVIIIIVAFATLLLLKKKDKKEVITPVEVASVSTQQIVTTVDADGKVAFRDKMSIYAKNTGKVANIPVKEGDSVNQGDVLINYDKSSLDTLKRQLEEAKLTLKSANLSLEALKIPADESQLKQLEAQIGTSEKNITDIENNIAQLNRDIDKAQTDLDGANILYSQGAISKTELATFEKALTGFENQKISAENNLESSKKQLEANKAQYESTKNKTFDPSNKNRIQSQQIAVEQARLRVSNLEKDIKKFEVSSVSPISGTLIKTHVLDGEVVSEGKLVAEVGNLNDLVIEALIPEYDMEGVTVSQDVLIKSETLNKEFNGKITKIYPLAEETKSGDKSVVKVQISLPADTGLKAGYTTKLTITTKVEENALVIPIISYMTEKVDDKSVEYVYVVKEDNTLEKRNIKVKTIKNSVASIEGLNEGEKIVVSPNETMIEGMQIVPMENTEQKVGIQ